MAAQRRDAGRFHAGGTAAHHQHVPGLVGLLQQVVAEGQLAAGRHIDGAADTALREAAEAALVAADAWPDLVRPAFQRLANDVRVGDVGASHADHVRVAAGDGRVHVLQGPEPAGDEGRHLAFRDAGDRHAHGQLVAGVLMHAADDLVAVLRAAMRHVDVVEDAFLEDAGDDLPVLVHVQAAREVVRADAGAHDEARPDHLPHRVQDFEVEPHAVLEAAAILVGALVGGLADELLDQEIVGAMHLDPVEAAFHRPAPRLCEGVDHLGDLVLRHRMRGHAGQRVDEDFRRRPGLRPRRTLIEAHMVDLREHAHAVRLHRLHELLVARDDAVVPGIHGHGAGLVDARRLDQRQAHAAPRPRLVIGDQVVRQVAAPQVGAVRGAQHTVLDFHPVDHERTEHVFQRHGRSPVRLPTPIMGRGDSPVKRDFSAAAGVKKAKALSLVPDMPHMWRSAGRRAGHRA